ncbi:MAG TPA: 3-methyl-2-oxobutanoate hydroxymethyltransferase [Polyangiaceae bacterium]
MTREKITVPGLLSRKLDGPRICAVTAYDATFARLLDQAGVDVLLVGDSLGMAVQGHRHTLPVTLDDICYHSRAVARSQPRAHICADLPFMSYQISVERAVESAGKLLQYGGSESVKLEGGAVWSRHVAAIVAAGIPVMGHLGLTPQSVHSFGGFRVQGRGEQAEHQLMQDAEALANAGVFAIVLESIPPELGRRITESVSVPTIGIGAGPHCDGQVLVCYDLLGLETELRPRFVRRFAELGQAVTAATRDYVQDVRAGVFPSAEHCFSPVAGRRTTPTLPDAGETAAEQGSAAGMQEQNAFDKVSG